MSPSHYWKLGVFVVAGFALAIVAVIYFGSSLLGRSIVTYNVYFDEAVDGLDVGSVVRYRGVRLGQVSAISVAPDHRHILVRCALAQGSLKAEGLAIGVGPATRLIEPPGLRAELALVGVTGEQIVLLDFVDPATHPVEPLPFPPLEPNIPSTPSTITSLLVSVEAAADQLPGLLSSVRAAADEGRSLVGEIGGSDLGTGAAQTLRRVDALLVTLQGMASRMSATGAPEEAGRALSQLDVVIGRVDRLLGQIGGDRGLVTSAQRTAQAVGGAAIEANAVGRQLQQTLRDADDVLATVRRLADEIERQPDLLLKGRASSRGAP